MRNGIFAFDVETTGLDPLENEIISIAMLILDERFEVVREKVIYAFPEKPVTEEAAKRNGYTPDKWLDKGAVSQAAMFSEVYNFVKPYNKLLPLGHNVKFDLGFLRSLFDDFDSDEFKNFFSYHSLDTVTAAIMFDMIQFHTMGVEYSLEKLCERFGIRLRNAHDALEDVRATVELFRHLYQVMGGSIPDTTTAPPVYSKMMKKEAGVWMFDRGKHEGKTVEEVAKSKPGYLHWMLKDVTELSDEQRAFLEECLKEKEATTT